MYCSPAPLVPRPSPELDNNIAPGTSPPLITLGNKYIGFITTPKLTHHVDARTTPYFTSRSCPPPWLIKNSNKNRNKYYYGTHSPSGTTPKRRPPLWPIIPTPTPILSIANPHPSPWPIIPHYPNQTTQNHQNAKCQLKAKSQRIPDKVST
jgi:hypothetical protein